MKIPTLNKHKKAIFISIGTVVIVALSIFGFLVASGFFSPRSDNSSRQQPNYDKPTDEQLEGGKAIEDYTDKQSNSGADPNSVGSDRPEKPVAIPGSTKAEVKIIVSSSNQNDGVLQVRTLISSIVNDGTCTLTLTKNGATVTKVANVQALPGSSTCKGFDIPVTELSSGIWSATISFENSTLKGSSTSSVKVL